MQIPHDDPRLSWPGAISLERTASYTKPWRIPFNRKDRFYPTLIEKAECTSGVRLAFKSDTRQVRAHFLPLINQTPQLDLFIDGSFHSTIDLTGSTECHFNHLPEGEKKFEIWLPQFSSFALQSLDIDDGASLNPVQDERPRWLTYGSSITHCRAAASPSQTWPSIVSRGLDWNLTSMGFGGECHLDIGVALTIRDFPADFISVCSGINVYGRASLNERSFQSSLIGTVDIIREKHPNTPILLISPIFGCHREDSVNAVNWTLKDIRAAVEETASKLRDMGDANIHYLSGLEIFGPDLSHLLPDDLHPNAEGYQVMGKNLLRIAQNSPEIFSLR